MDFLSHIMLVPLTEIDVERLAAVICALRAMVVMKALRRAAPESSAVRPSDLWDGFGSSAELDVRACPALPAHG